VNDDCLKLTTYFGERERVERSFLADELLDLYGANGIATSVLLRGAAGFGLKHRFHTDRLLTLSEDLPLVSIAVDARERIEAILEEVEALHESGLVTLERTRLLSGDIESVMLPEELHEATKLTIYVGRLGVEARGWMVGPIQRGPRERSVPPRGISVRARSTRARRTVRVQSRSKTYVSPVG
jgi:PII-like signaling protein